MSPLVTAWYKIQWQVENKYTMLVLHHDAINTNKGGPRKSNPCKLGILPFTASEVDKYLMMSSSLSSSLFLKLKKIRFWLNVNCHAPAISSK